VVVQQRPKTRNHGIDLQGKSSGKSRADNNGAGSLLPCSTRRRCRDPDDDKFLELAVNGRADVIISGDADLLVLDTFRGIPIITAAAFGHAQAI
jgi:predicted nucleic acid-binding protein